MEFLRYGSRIPGAYQWGCCAICIIQDFKQDPDEKSSIEVVSGDSGTPFLDFRGNAQFLGPTYRDIFNQRLRIGTFSNDDMPNHVFLAVLTDWQLHTVEGKKWLRILKESGFEFIRSTDNSVYSGTGLFEDGDDCEEQHLNHIFGLFRNIGSARSHDPFTPPEAWTDLEGNITEVSSLLTYEQKLSLEENRYEEHLRVWNTIGPVEFLTKEGLREEGVPVILAGKFSDYPQESEEIRERRLNDVKEKEKETGKASSPAWTSV